MAKPIALELWTIRDSLKNEADFRVAMQRTRDAGYPAVELAGVSPDIPASTIKSVLDECGLACMATQVSLGELTDGIDKTIADLKTLSCDHTALAAGPGDMRSADGYAKLARILTDAGRTLSDHGIRLAYHNHSFEFERYGDRTGFDILYDESDPRYLEAKIDTAWLQKAGADVIAWIRKLGDRVSVVHIKDYTIKDNEIVLTEVGEGNLNWSGILEACKSVGMKWYVVEQDRCERDPFESIAISYRNLERML